MVGLKSYSTHNLWLSVLFNDVYTLNNCFIIIILIFNNLYCYSGTLQRFKCWRYMYQNWRQRARQINTKKLVSGKEDPLKRPYVILINIHEYECQQQNQPRKKIFRDRLMKKCVNECMNEYLLLETFILNSLFHTEHNKASRISRNILTNANMCLL